MEREELKVFLNKKLENVELQGLPRHLKTKHPEVVAEIIKNTEYLKGDKVNFLERIYQIVNDMYEIPKCEKLVDSCKGILRFTNFKKGYQKHCSECYTKSEYFSKTMRKAQTERDEEKEKARRKKISEAALGKSKDEKAKIDKKKKETLKKNFGSAGLKNKKIREKKIKTNRERYGGKDWAAQTIETQRKRRTTEEKRYGGLWMGSDEAKEVFNKIWTDKMGDYPKTLAKSRGFELVSKYDKAHTAISLKCKKCNYVFQILWNSFEQHGVVCPGCYPHKHGISKQEKDLCEYIKSLGFAVIENDRKIIKPYELDMIIPSEKIAIEYCGLAFHSTEGKNLPKWAKTEKNYHQVKLNMCIKKGYNLITIFEDEWLQKEKLVKERLKHILNKHSGKTLRATECEIKLVTKYEKKEFFEKFHIQGNDNASLCLGLYYKDKLLSAMSFTHGSVSKGVKKKDIEVWELNRFCGDYDWHVYGAASKLLNYFKENYKWKTIFSYCDRRWSQGNLYKKLGFEEDIIKNKQGNIIERAPNYWYWGNGIIGRCHRYKYRKQVLKKFKNYNENYTEHQIMALEGYCWIYDCGHLKFVLINK